jgi:hypothetical protein
MANTNPACSPKITVLGYSQKPPLPSSAYDAALPRPALRVDPSHFWASSIDIIPRYNESPWNYYEPFILRGERILVTCNHGSEVREMKIASSFDRSAKVQRIRHINFLQVHEMYDFEDKLYVLFEYIDFTLQDVLDISPSPTEPQIAHIASEVRVTNLFGPATNSCRFFMGWSLLGRTE